MILVLGTVVYEYNQTMLIISKLSSSEFDGDSPWDTEPEPSLTDLGDSEHGPDASQVALLTYVVVLQEDSDSFEAVLSCGFDGGGT